MAAPPLAIDGALVSVGINYSVEAERALVGAFDFVDFLEVEPQALWLQAERSGVLTLDEERLQRVGDFGLPVLCHGVGYPIGGTRSPDPAQLPLLREVIQALRPLWMSEHLAFNEARGAGGEPFGTGFMLPPRQTERGARAAADSIHRVADELGMPFAVETGVNYWPPRPEEAPDGAWVARVAELADCGLVVDLHNLWTNERNGRQTVLEFLSQIPLERVWEVHLAGGEERHGMWIDGHNTALPPALAKLARDAIPTFPNLRAVVFETFPAFLPGLGSGFLPQQVHLIRDLLPKNRLSAVAGQTAPSLPLVDADPSPGEWEDALAHLVVGGAATSKLEQELGAHPGTRLVRELLGEFRASMVAGGLPMSTFLTMRQDGPEAFEQRLAAFWKVAPPERFAATEALRFASWLRENHHLDPLLADVLKYEVAVLEVLTAGLSLQVELSHDPRVLLPSLIEHRVPCGVPRGTFVLEVAPGRVAMPA